MIGKGLRQHGQWSCDIKKDPELKAQYTSVGKDKDAQTRFRADWADKRWRPKEATKTKRQAFSTIDERIARSLPLASVYLSQGGESSVLHFKVKALTATNLLGFVVFCILTESFAVCHKSRSKRMPQEGSFMLKNTRARLPRSQRPAGLASRAQMRPSHGGIGAFGTQRGSGQSRGAAADSLALLQVPIG